MANMDPLLEEFSAAAQRIADLAREFESLPYPQLRGKSAELLQSVDTLHRTPLERLMALLQEGANAELLERLSADPLVGQLFQLYDLIPSDDRTVVEAALCSFRDYASVHGGDIRVQDVVDGAVSLAVSGACLACSRSTRSLSQSIEEILRREYPGFRSLEILEMDWAGHPWPTAPEAS